MATHSNHALRLPSSLMDDLRIASMRDGVSVDGFILQAITEKMAVLRAGGLLPELTAAEQSAYLEARAARARAGRLAEVLRKAGTTAEVLPGDEIPDGWLDGPEANGTPSSPRPGMDR